MNVKIISFMLILVIIIFGITFAILNAEPVTVHYYIGVTQLPLSLVIMIAFGIGLILGFLLIGINIIRLKTERYHLKKRLRLVEQEVENLRTIPIRD